MNINNIILKKKSPKLKITALGKEVEKLEPLYIAARNVKWGSHHGKHCARSSKNQTQNYNVIQQFHFWVYT